MSERPNLQPRTPTGPRSAGPESGTLVRLAERVTQVTAGSCGATATAGWDGAAAPARVSAVTHPDLAPLVDIQWEYGSGPIQAALDADETAYTDDLLTEPRWPEFRGLALDSGVRCSATLPFRCDGVALTVTLYSFRPGELALVPGETEVLGELAVRAVAQEWACTQARTQAAQLEGAMRTRPAIDQACGILMHVLGCDAEEALGVLRRLSQRTNTRLAELAAAVVRTRGRGIEGDLEKFAPDEAHPAA
ncbi:ANTAR domain-containing protein [Streptomyces sp. NPDC051940]|uniref:ANTAR domain-containing response regulator n=1 Tax=Streptomyces sp. NPDC051940 TaxID=3155675 RepID=UPI003425DD91